MSCRLHEWRKGTFFRPRLYASLFPVDFISVRPSNRAQTSATCLRNESTAGSIRSSTDLSVISSADVPFTRASIHGSCLNLNSIVSEELSSV